MSQTRIHKGNTKYFVMKINKKRAHQNFWDVISSTQREIINIHVSNKSPQIYKVKIVNQSEKQAIQQELEALILHFQKRIE